MALVPSTVPTTLAGVFTTICGDQILSYNAFESVLNTDSLSRVSNCLMTASLGSWAKRLLELITTKTWLINSIKNFFIVLVLLKLMAFLFLRYAALRFLY